MSSWQRWIKAGGIVTPDNNDNQIHWVPHHRLIFPSSRGQGQAAVSVVSEIAKVEFSVI